MSKRGPGASFGGDEERYGKSHTSEAMADNGNQAQRATAAQMAKRKIALAKSAGRRSASPAVSTAPVGATNAQFQIPTPGAGAGAFSFNFGQTNTAFGQQAQQNGSPAPFQSGAGNQTQPSSTNVFAQPSTNSFGTSFNSTSTQPQQNGFSFGQQQSSSSFSQFGQQQPSSSQFGQPPSNPSSFTFGQTQQNGATPEIGTSSIFKSFGQQNQTNGQNGTTFQFGTPQPEKKEDPKPSSTFGGFGQKPQEIGDKPASLGISSIFGGSGQAAQQNGEKNIFGTGTSNAPFTSSSLGTSSIFSNLGQNPLSNVDKPLFPSTSVQETPKAASSSLFAGFGSQPQTNGGTSDTAKKPPSTPAFGGFGQPVVNGVKAAESQTDQSNAFGQAPGTQSKLPSFGIPQAQEQTPKPSNLFPAQPQVTQSQLDANMTTPDQTPQKSTSTSTAHPESSSTPAPQPKSLFDRVDKDESEKALGRTSTPPLFSFMSSEQPKDSAPKPLFTPSTTTMFGSSVHATTPKPLAPELTPQPPQTAPAKSVFDRVEPPQFKTQTPVGNGIFGGDRDVETPTQLATTAAAGRGSSRQSSTSSTPHQKKKLKGLNTGLLRHLQASDPERDWSNVFLFYQAQVTKICSGQPTEGTATSPSNAAKSESITPRASAGFAGAQTPKPNSLGSALFSKPPETAPVQKRRLFEEDDDDAPIQPPATEKRVKLAEPMSYPKLPETASNTAKLFEAALEKPKATPPAPKVGFTPSAKPLFLSSETSNVQSGATNSSSGFKPTGFQPTLSVPAGGNDMFAAFGKAAKAQEEKDRSKRKAEDYDSDEETAEEWEKKDQEEQERKRATIAEAAKAGTGFKFNAAVTTGSLFTTTPGSDTTATETPKAQQSKSLFDRITPASPPKTAPSKPSIFTRQTPDAADSSHNQAPATTVHKPTSNIFGQAGSDPSKPSANIFGFLRDKENSSQLGEDVEKEQGSGDKTFNPNTPIKFGSSMVSTTPAAAPPKFTGLFGSSAPPSGLSLSEAAAGSGKLAPPSAGFAFGVKTGSLDASRATTPGIATDGEGSTATGAEDADGEEQELPQIEDQTSLQPDEKKANDILFELGEGKNALCKKYEDKQGTKEWVSKGKGRLYIVKNKTTGKTRILLKIAPFGKLAMNYEPVKGIEYKISSAAGKIVSGAFFDHLHVREPKLGQFTIQVKEADDAKEIARILNDETPQ